jgi:hypothetical protein
MKHVLKTFAVLATLVCAAATGTPAAAQSDSIRLEFADFESPTWPTEADSDSMVAEGITGPLAWRLTVDGTLTITGTGEMPNYSYRNYPWETYYENIKKVIVGGGVTTIGNNAFSSCFAMKEITIPNSVTAIGEEAFLACQVLTEITLPEGVTTIGRGAFKYCYALAEITIPNGVTTIGEYTFNKCHALKAATLGSGVTIIGEWAFSECNALTAVTFPDGVTTIGENAFSECLKLTEITIPNSVTTIGRAAFYDCHALHRITIPASVTTIGDSAFRCRALTAIEVAADNAHYASEDGVLFDKAKTTIIQYPIGRRADHYAIPAGVKTIEMFAFYRCSALTSVTIGDSVMTLGKWAFADCPALAGVICLAVEPPTIHKYSFNSDAARVLYVPAASIDKYKADERWSAAFATENIRAIGL